jgi:leucyl/phenylalanyl-tRNA---protein transferase
LSDSFKSDALLRFPPIERADDQGLLCVGGNLSPENLLLAYRQGIFPWFDPSSPIMWWCPNPRLILYPHQFKVHRSLQKTLKKPYSLKIDQQFEQVMHYCASENNREGRTWIGPEMISAYTKLHLLGYAHSFEIWQDGQLIGGLYGISLGRAFFGESMFHLQRDASKVALYELCQFALQHGIEWIDCQNPNPFLEKLGAKPVARNDFLRQLKLALNVPDTQGIWIK